MSNTIELSRKQSIAWKCLEDSTTNEILFGGGAGSGKSMLGCLWHITRRTKYAGSRGLIGRAKLKTLKETTLVTFFNTCNAMGYRSGVDYNYNQQDQVINWSNGSQTILKDLFYYPSDPDFTSLGGSEYTDAFIDEVNEVTARAVGFVNSRIRYRLTEYGVVQKLFMTCNPSDGWVKDKYVKKDGLPIVLKQHQKFIQALITDNPDKAFRELYIKQLERMDSDYDKQRLLYGDWDATREVISPFAVQWRDSFIKTDVHYDYVKQLIISVDFNLVPFCVTFHNFYADEKGWHWIYFDEAEIKQGSIPSMIDLIKERYGSVLGTAILTGDAMGNRGDISQRDNASLYIQLMRGLGLRESQLKVRSNPTHENSRADVNYVYKHLQDIRVSDRCTGGIRDNKNVQIDATGSIIKGNRNDLNQRADYLDTIRYLVHNVMYKWIEHHQKTNFNININR